MNSKKKCTFTELLRSEFTISKKFEEIDKVFCTMWKAVFSIKYGGHFDVRGL